MKGSSRMNIRKDRGEVDWWVAFMLIIIVINAIVIAHNANNQNEKLDQVLANQDLSNVDYVLTLGQNPASPDALTLGDMVTGTLVCRMQEQETVYSYVVTGVGVEVSNLEPLLYWSDGNETRRSLQEDGVIPNFDGTWSSYWLRAGVCDQSP
jgi:hypothetical protein